MGHLLGWSIVVVGVVYVFWSIIHLIVEFKELKKEVELIQEEKATHHRLEELYYDAKVEGLTIVLVEYPLTIEPWIKVFSYDDEIMRIYGDSYTLYTSNIKLTFSQYEIIERIEQDKLRIAKASDIFQTE